MQSWRNALQKQLRSHTSTLGVTLARFIIALPLAILYIVVLYEFYPQSPPLQLSLALTKNILIASLSQIAATALMVMLFKTRNYAIGVGLAKSEAVIAASLGALFFSAPLSPKAWCGVVIGAMAVWLMSLSSNTLSIQEKNNKFSSQTLVIGLASGLCFAICTLYIRESALILRHQLQINFLISAGWTLLLIIGTQTLLLTLWLFLKEPLTLKQLYQHRKLTTSVSICSFLGSVGWFTAMSLQTVAMVKTLGQVEVLFTLLISFFWCKEKLVRSDYLGLGLVVISASLVVLA